jgi:hypothetical protein
MAAYDQVTAVVLADTDVDGKTNEITRFRPLLDQIGDLRDTVITADALCRSWHNASYVDLVVMPRGGGDCSRRWGYVVPVVGIITGF